MGTESIPGIVIMGASSFPRSEQFTSSEAFETAYNKIKSYFLESEGLDLPDSHCLDLFNDDSDPNDLDDKLEEFLKPLVKDQNLTDLFIYYVGHGGIDSEAGFVLATKKIKDDNKALSGLLFKNLARRIAKTAKGLRVYFILDCCFSGEAAFDFQFTNSSEFIGRQFVSNFPASGTTLLCSSSKDLPSFIVKERNITMFSEGLERALTKGSKNINQKYLTLREVCDLADRHIKTANESSNVRPEIHSPDQQEGDISQLVRIFPNYSYLTKSFDTDARSVEIRMMMAENNLRNAVTQLMDFVQDFDEGQTYLDDVIILAANCNDLEDCKQDLNRKDYIDERKGYYKEILSLLSQLSSQ